MPDIFRGAFVYHRFRFAFQMHASTHNRNFVTLAKVKMRGSLVIRKHAYLGQGRSFEILPHLEVQDLDLADRL